MEGQVDVRMKVVFTGESNVGKTTLIYWETQRIFNGFQCTIGVDFRRKYYQIGTKKVQTLLWDTAGAERYRSMRDPLYRNSHAICVCFSLNDRNSFEKVPTWVKGLQSNEVKCPLFLVGCKADLEHVVTPQEIKDYASKEGMAYFQISTKSDIGVNDSMQKVMESAYEYYQANPHARIKAVIKPTQHDRFNGFCWT